MPSENEKIIFVVDDNEIQSVALEDYLTRKTKYKVKLFSTGEECLDHLDERPSVVVLDYNLSSVNKDAANGITILEEIKKANHAIHVIMLSSQEAYGTALRTLIRGAEEYVIKDEDAFEKVAALVNKIK